jgi:hypothetical protein
MKTCTTCGFTICRCNEDQSNWQTIDQILDQLVEASKKLTTEQRATLAFEFAMRLAQTPVGKLPKIGAK